MAFGRMLCSLLTALAVAEGAEIVLATFDGAAGTNHSWVQKNDPVMGGESWGSFVVDTAAGLGIMVGEVNIVPKLQAPGFIKAESNDKIHKVKQQIFPDIRGCEGIAITARADTAEGDADYTGYRFSFGNAHVPWGKFFAYGYKANFQPTFGEFGTVELKFEDFTDYWDDATGDPIKTCQDKQMYCPDAVTKSDIATMSVWAEGVSGKVDLKLREIKAIGCPETPPAEDDGVHRWTLEALV